MMHVIDVVLAALQVTISTIAIPPNLTIIFDAINKRELLIIVYFQTRTLLRNRNIRISPIQELNGLYCSLFAVVRMDSRIILIVPHESTN